MEGIQNIAEQWGMDETVAEMVVAIARQDWGALEAAVVSLCVSVSRSVGMQVRGTGALSQALMLFTG